MIYNDVYLNEYGFYSLKELPSDEERESYYREKYYQEALAGYEADYSEDELKHIRARLDIKHQIIEKRLALQRERLVS